MYRVHCANLFEQTIYFRKKYNDEVQNSTDSSVTETTNKTLTTLNQLYNTSGCMEAMCIFLGGEGKICLHVTTVFFELHILFYSLQGPHP